MLETGGAWMSACGMGAGGCRHTSGSARHFGLRATLVSWSCVGLRVVLRPPLLYIRILCVTTLYQPLQNRTLGGYCYKSLRSYRRTGNLNKYRQMFLLCYRGVGVKK